MTTFKIPSGTNIVSDGWTVFNPTAPSGSGSGFSGAGTRIIYVSSSTGTTIAGGGTGTQLNPLSTIAEGSSLLRSGFDDWLLLKCGDTFTNDALTINSGSGLTSAPDFWAVEGTHTVTGVKLISSYGIGLSPIVQWDSQNAIFQTGTHNSGGYFFQNNGNPDINNVSIVNLDFYCYTRDPNTGSFSSTAANNGFAAAFQFLGNCNQWIFEGNRFRYCASTIVLNGTGTVPPFTHGCSNFVIRRNTAMFNYTATTGNESTQGMYFFATTNVLLEENIINNNGWLEAGGCPQLLRNHNVYFQGGCVGNNIVRHNILTADYGGFKMDEGMKVYDNYFAYSCPTMTGAQGNVYAGGTSYNYTYNVVQHASDRTDGGLVQIGESLTSLPCYAPVMDHNITSLSNSTSPNFAYFIVSQDAHFTATFGSGSTTITVTDPDSGNGISVYGLSPGMTVTGTGIPANTTITNINISSWVGQTGPVTISNSTTSAQTNVAITLVTTNATATNNLAYGYSVNNPGTNGVAEGTDLAGVGFVPLSGVNTTLSNNTYLPAGGGGYPDPGRSIETYALNVLGRSVHTGSDAQGILNQFQDVIQNVYFNQTKSNWDTRLTAKTLNNYIRAGFNFPQL